jgi:hypothetical protein
VRPSLSACGGDRADSFRTPVVIPFDDDEAITAQTITAALRTTNRQGT